MRWRDLALDPAILAALEHAGPRPEDGDQNAKRRWSERFADACAVACAEALRRSDLPEDMRILPRALGEGTEPLTPLGSGQSKRIDVTVADPVLGLEIGLSLKGLNFRDGRSANFDKNLTGRLYELGDEMRHVHEHLPHAFMAGLLFLPLAAVSDKTERAPSSFANAAVKLRARTGRLDVALGSHAARCDAGFVALYALGGEDGGAPRGACRLIDVAAAPPRRGRPRVEATRSLKETVGEIVSRARAETRVDWAEPEPDR